VVTDAALLVAVFLLIKSGAPDVTEGSGVGDTAGTGAAATVALVGAFAPGDELGELAVEGAVGAVTVLRLLEAVGSTSPCHLG
jgi:hypothetical protein